MFYFLVYTQLSCKYYIFDFCFIFSYERRRFDKNLERRVERVSVLKIDISIVVLALLYCHYNLTYDSKISVLPIKLKSVYWGIGHMERPIHSKFHIQACILTVNVIIKNQPKNGICMQFNFRSWSRMKFLPKLYHTIRSYLTSKAELLQLIKEQQVRTNIGRADTLIPSTFIY